MSDIEHSPFKTRCPHCQAQFKVGPEQLQQAHGAVRCGRCMDVFQAADHRVTEPAVWSDSDSAAPRSSLALELDLSDSFLSLDGPQRDPLRSEDFSTLAGAGRPSQDEVPDESWAEALLRELDDPAPSTTAPITSTPAPQPPPPAADLAPLVPAQSAPADALELSLLTDPEPIPVAPPPHFSRPQLPVAALFGGSLLIIALLAALAGQYLYFHADRLARTDSLRPLYALTCDLTGCTLPERVDLSRVRSTNLLVRPHPDHSGALQVDALLFNHADYRQPFPVLELTLHGAGGTPVAQRRFQPDEYLQGDLAGLQQMPPDVPIRIGLALERPAGGVEGYQLRLLPANN